MAWVQEFPGVAAAGERAERAMRWPVGMASPLWAVFGAAASGGVAYWWMSQWTRAVNVEALTGFQPPLPLFKRIEIVAEPAPAPVAAVTPPAAEPVTAPLPIVVAEPVVEATPAPVALAEPEIVAAPAPVVIEPVAAPAKPKAAKPAAPKVKAEPPPPPDDLTVMTGIGPKLSEALAARGVTRFAQIAKWTADDLKAVDVALSLKGRAVREAWVAQAKRLAGR